MRFDGLQGGLLRNNVSSTVTRLEHLYHLMLLANFLPANRCVIWRLKCASTRYPKISIARRTEVYAHRFVCQLMWGAAENGDLEVAHSCGNRQCVSPFHLRWATHEENEADKIKHGTRCIGERSPSCRLNETEVLMLLNEFSSGVTQTELAKRYEVTRSTIAAITQGRNWAHIPHPKKCRKDSITYDRGSAHSQSILNEKQVLEIRRRFSSGSISISELGRQYNVSKDCINHIVHYRTWKHVR